MAKVQLDIKGLSMPTKPRKDGRWQAIYRKNEDAYYIYAHSFSDLQDKVLKFIKNTPAKKKSITLGAYLEEWSKTKASLLDLSESTIKGYKSSINKHIKPKNIYKKQINQITAQDIEELLLSIEATRPRKDVYQLLLMAFTKAKGIYIKDNPMDFVEKCKSPKGKGIPLTRSQQNKFLEKIKGQPYELYFVFLIYTGARRSEALALRWDDINIDKGYIQITKQTTQRKTDGKTKTPKAVRFIPILPALLPYIEKNKSTGKIFNYSRDWVSNKARELFDELNFPKKLTLHSLRHTFSTRLRETGIPEEIIRDLMGHTSVTTTHTYITTLPEYTLEIIRKINPDFDINFDIKPQE